MEIKKISTRQFMLFYIMLSLAVAIRIFPTIVSEEAKGHSYLAVIFGAAGTLLLCLLFARIIRSMQGKSLCEIVEEILSKPVGKVVLFIYMLWCFFIFSLYLRFYAEQMAASLLPKCQIELIILVMILFIYKVLKGGIVGAARLNQILFGVFTAVFVVVSVATVASKFDFQNLNYLSGFDAKGLFTGSLFTFAGFSYIIFMFFFYHKVRERGSFKSLSVKAVCLSALCGVVIILCTVGVLGYLASSRLEMPYFSVVKNITVFTSVKQFMPVLYTIWMIVDYTIIFIFAYITLTIFQHIFSFESKKSMIAPILLLGSAMALFVSRNAFLLDAVTKHIMLYGNLILQPILLPLIYIVGKLRKKI